MRFWALVHGIVFGLPLVVLTTLCVADAGRLGKIVPWLGRRRRVLRRRPWQAMVTFAWLTVFSGMGVMYLHPDYWMKAPEAWVSWALPWMASWGAMVPITMTACIYLTRRGEEKLVMPMWFRRAVSVLMLVSLINVLVSALLGSVTAQGVFYP